MISVRAHRDYWERSSYYKTSSTTHIDQTCVVCGKEFVVKRYNGISWRKVKCCSPECLKRQTLIEGFPKGRGTGGYTPTVLKLKCKECGTPLEMSIERLAKIKTISCGNCGHIDSR